MIPLICKRALLLAAGLLAGSVALADIVTTKDGARLVGTIKAVNGGAVTLATTYAGVLTIKQTEVVTIETSQADSIRLASGTRIDGKVTPLANGTVQIVGTDGTVTSSVQQVAMIWPAGTRDPLTGAWTYEATVDIEGTSGNKSSLNTGLGFKAELVNPHDTLKYFANYDRAVTEGVKSADQLRLGIDYADNFTADQQWFLRDVGGFDRVMGVRYEDVAAGGYGFDFIKTKQDVLLARVGIAYRYDNYYAPGTSTVSTVAGDFELNHDYKGKYVEVNNALTFVPSLKDFANFLLTQDSYVQAPLAATLWKLRVGVSNNYNSRPTPGIKKLDTLYYLRLVYDFGASAPAAP